MSDAEIIAAVRSKTHALIPLRGGLITGYAPLNLSDEEPALTSGGDRGFAVYVDGLTSQEASDLLKVSTRPVPVER
jgi:hypothetical protein